MKVERRKTSYNKELDLSDQLASVVGGNQVIANLFLLFVL
jgi:hypothetical protein